VICSVSLRSRTDVDDFPLPLIGDGRDLPAVPDAIANDAAAASVVETAVDGELSEGSTRWAAVREAALLPLLARDTTPTPAAVVAVLLVGDGHVADRSLLFLSAPGDNTAPYVRKAGESESSRFLETLFNAACRAFAAADAAETGAAPLLAEDDGAKVALRGLLMDGSR